MRTFLGVIFSLGIIFGAANAAHADLGYHNHSLYGAIGFTPGGVALGADYEYLGSSEFGFGGLIRMYQKDTNPKVLANGLVNIGGFIRPHFTKKSWDLFFSPGLSIISIESAIPNTRASVTTLGAIFGTGLVYELTSSVALGVEAMQTHVLFSEEWRGLLISDFMFRFRLSF